MSQAASTAERATVADPSWRPLYRVGAIAAGLAVVAYVVALVLFVVTAKPPTSGGAAILEHVHAHRGLYALKQILWIAPNLLMMLVVLTLAATSARGHKSFALVAGVVAGAAWAVAVAWPTTGEGSLGMVVLSDHYAKAATEAERAPFVAGAELLLALNGLPAVIIGVLQTLGLLLIALLMRRGPFAPGIVRLGIATGALGIVAEALRPLLGWAYAAYGLVLFAWLIWLAVALWRLADGAEEAGTKVPRPRSRPAPVTVVGR
jgi:hypothetical protein